jgi:hypothetical protein
MNADINCARLTFFLLPLKRNARGCKRSLKSGQRPIARLSLLFSPARWNLLFPRFFHTFAHCCDQVIGEEDLEQFMTRMQQHVDRSKHNLNSLFEEVISSVEKDCTFKPSLEPTRAVSRSS